MPRKETAFSLWSVARYDQIKHRSAVLRKKRTEIKNLSADTGTVFGKNVEI